MARKKFPIVFGWLALEMIKLDDYCAMSQNFHKVAELNLLWNYGLSVTLVFRVLWFKEELI